MAFIYNPRPAGAAVINNVDAIPIALGRTSTDVSRSGPTSFIGAAFQTTTRVQLNRIHLRIATRAGAPELTLGIYQARDGLPNKTAMPLVASVVDFAVPAGAANFTITPSEGLVLLNYGIYFLLWGRSAAAGGNFSLRAWSVNAQDLQNDNVPAGLYPTVYDTILGVDAGLPATLDTRETTGDLTEDAANNALTMRLQRV